jgi:phosphoserine phosphatase RsbU/P
VSRGPGWESLVNVSFPRGVGVAGFCVDYGTALALQEARTDARFFDAVDAATGVRTRSLLCAPIVHEAKVFGCIELINAPDGFDRHALACADALAAALGERLARG